MQAGAGQSGLVRDHHELGTVRAVWTGTSLLVLAASLALPLTAATTASAAAGLAALHLTVGAAVIPGMARTARPS